MSAEFIRFSSKASAARTIDAQRVNHAIHTGENAQIIAFVNPLREANVVGPILDQSRDGALRTLGVRPPRAFSGAHGAMIRDYLVALVAATRRTMTEGEIACEICFFPHEHGFEVSFETPDEWRVGALERSLRTAAVAYLDRHITARDIEALLEITADERRAWTALGRIRKGGVIHFEAPVAMEAAFVRVRDVIFIDAATRRAWLEEDRKLAENRRATRKEEKQNLAAANLQRLEGFYKSATVEAGDVRMRPVLELAVLTGALEKYRSRARRPDVRETYCHAIEAGLDALRKLISLEDNEANLAAAFSRLSITTSDPLHGAQQAFSYGERVATMIEVATFCTSPAKALSRITTLLTLVYKLSDNIQSSQNPTLSPHPHETLAFGFRITNFDSSRVSI